MRVLVDQNLPATLVAVLHEAGHDVVHTRDVGLERATDEQIFECCCAEERLLVTADKKLTKFLATSRATCSSVLITRDVRTTRSPDLGRLIVANLPAIAAVIDERGHAVFTLTPSKPIRAALLPLGLHDKETAP
ncbi:MAG: DUF5615 family PIN-like protein [Acidimicrobiales bacterium]